MSGQVIDLFSRKEATPIHDEVAQKMTAAQPQEEWLQAFIDDRATKLLALAEELAGCEDDYDGAIVAVRKIKAEVDKWPG